MSYTFFVAKYNIYDFAKYNEIINQAKQKLNFIISRYGDADGQRLTKQYFEKIVDEIIKQRYYETLFFANAKKELITV